MEVIVHKHIGDYFYSGYVGTYPNPVYAIYEICIILEHPGQHIAVCTHVKTIACLKTERILPHHKRKCFVGPTILLPQSHPGQFGGNIEVLYKDCNFFVARQIFFSRQIPTMPRGWVRQPGL